MRYDDVGNVTWCDGVRPARQFIVVRRGYPRALETSKYL